jgi:tRNA1(Val) A37 N6-methylase TrmN6
VLGGRLRLRQKRRGHRVGHDAILLAAATGARPGDRAIDLGAGVGAAGLALAQRVPDLEVTLVEIDPELAAIATENIMRNGLAQRVRAVSLDATAPEDEFAACGIASGMADRVLMDPPFNDPVRRTSRPIPPGARPIRRPRRAAGWIDTAAPPALGGTLTLIWRADGLAEVWPRSIRASAASRSCRSGRPGQPAIRILVRASKGSRTPLTLLPGLLLNDGDGRPTAEAEAVLRGGEPLPLIGD